tara:strand:+ start:21256 stop:22338 length:1083 start_codon:yes stop_codon:yes gene_type:complete
VTPSYNHIHNSFKLNGTHFNRKYLEEVAYSFIKEGQPYESVIGNFLIDWLDDKDFVSVNTSGSTGKPKSVELKKQAMVNSAIATGDFFNLKPTDSALHCLPSEYIAGKMMLVRAMILGLELDFVKPSARPFINQEKQYQFCAMVPLQLSNSLDAIQNIETLIIGGSKVSQSLQEELKMSSSKFYETYGMTETVTHVAVRQLKSLYGKADVYFNAMPKVNFSQDERQCLVINAPKIINEALVTNDIINLISTHSFEWLGRYDNVINSGGVKLFPEQIEQKLQPIFKDRFIVVRIKDKILGEKLVLIVENPSDTIDTITAKIHKLKTLHKFEIPKAIYCLDAFVETDSGKIQRSKSLKKVLG